MHKNDGQIYSSARRGAILARYYELGEIIHELSEGVKDPNVDQADVASRLIGCVIMLRLLCIAQEGDFDTISVKQ